PFQTPAGQITITGNLLNTGKGQIKALGGYVNVTVNNDTAYDVIVQRLDVTEKGGGKIVLNDRAKAVSGGVYQRTTYLTNADGTVTRTVQDMKEETTVGYDGNSVEYSTKVVEISLVSS